MGAVYRATFAKLNRDAAIKILPDALADDPDCRDNCLLFGRGRTAKAWQVCLIPGPGGEASRAPENWGNTIAVSGYNRN